MLAVAGRPLAETWRLPAGELCGLWRAYQCSQARFAASVVWALNVALGGDKASRMAMGKGCRWQNQTLTLAETYGATMAAQIDATYQDMEAKLAKRRKRARRP